MFTGLVECAAPVRRTIVRGTGIGIWVAVPPGWEIREGESVCVSGACLSIAQVSAAQVPGEQISGEQLAASEMLFELSEETLRRTWFGLLKVGDEVNLERAMRLSDRLDGHLVAGHVDGQGKIAAVVDSGDGGRRITVEVQAGFERWLVEKGSVAVDGVSLTVVEPRGRRFDVAAIPITLARTTLGRAEPGQPVNLEADPIGKWIERLLSARS